MTGGIIRPRLVQNSRHAIGYSRTWTGVKANRFSGGNATYSRTRGASAKYVVTGTSVALVSRLAPTRGWANVCVNGKLSARINLRRAAARGRGAQPSAIIPSCRRPCRRRSGASLHLLVVIRPAVFAAV
ncbi:MAG: hypothetical protein MUQ32_18310, partial [Chloroflexi bacterium]|nr:hypothetical protein [Chloroflexota bacterium]